MGVNKTVGREVTVFWTPESRCEAMFLKEKV